MSWCINTPVCHPSLLRWSPHSQWNLLPARRGRRPPVRWAPPPRIRHLSECRGLGAGSPLPRKRRVPPPPGPRNHKERGHTSLQRDRRTESVRERKQWEIHRRNNYSWGNVVPCLPGPHCYKENDTHCWTAADTERRNSANNLMPWFPQCLVQVFRPTELKRESRRRKKVVKTVGEERRIIKCCLRLVYLLYLWPIRYTEHEMHVQSSPKSLVNISQSRSTCSVDCM